MSDAYRTDGSVPEVAALEAEDNELLERFKDLPWRPLVAVEEMSARPVKPKVVRREPHLVLEVAWGEENIRFVGAHPFPDSPEIEEECQAVMVEDTRGGSHFFLEVFNPDSDESDCIGKSWASPATTTPVSFRSVLVLESPHPSGRPYRHEIRLQDALMLGPGDPLHFQFPMVEALNRRIVPPGGGRFLGEWGLGDGVLWLPRNKPEARDNRYDPEMKAETKGFTAQQWPNLLNALAGKFRELDFDGPEPPKREHYRRMADAAQGKPTIVRGGPRPARDAFDGKVAGFDTIPSVSFGKLGYLLFYFPSKEKARMVVVDSGDGHKGLYVFVGENCVENAENWATRGHGWDFRKAREAALRWLPHIGDWRGKAEAIIKAEMSKSP